jgi:hypothetical protein
MQSHKPKRIGLGCSQMAAWSQPIPRYGRKSRNARSVFNVKHFQKKL